MLTREISKEELEALKKGKIPAFDAVFEFDRYGKAVFAHNKKFGVISKYYEILLEGIYDNIQILGNGCIVAKFEGVYLLFDKQAYLIRPKGFETKQEAIEYSVFF